MEYTLTAPLFVVLPRKKKADYKFMLNLNVYRNTHYQILNQAKIKFKEIMTQQIMTLPEQITVKAHYELYLPNKRLCDISNYTTVINKFFQDALVELKKLPDDNYKYWLGMTDSFGGVDKENPRCEITLYLT